MIPRHLIVLSLAGLVGATSIVGSLAAPRLTAVAQSVLGSGLTQLRPDMPVFARTDGDGDIPRDIATTISQFTPANGKLPFCGHKIGGGGIRFEKILFIRRNIGPTPFSL